MTGTRTTKICSKCEEEKLLEEFSKRRASADGYQSYCKCCVKRYQQSPEGKLSIKRAQKKYDNSPAKKLAQKKYRNSPKGILTQKNYRRSPERKRIRNIYNSSPERKLAIKEYNNTPARRLAIKKYENSPARKLSNKKYYTSSKGRLTIKRYVNSPEGKRNIKKHDNSLKRKLSRKEYLKTPKGKALISRGNHNRRACKADVTVGTVDEQKIYDRCNNKCVYCGDTENLSVDHVVAISVGGPHIENNLVIACRSCNSSKGAKPVEEWLATRPCTISKSISLNHAKQSRDKTHRDFSWLQYDV